MTPPRPASASQNRFKLVAVLVVVTGLLVAWRLGVFHELAEPARVASTLRGLGGWGYLAFIVTYALFQPFGVPGTVFVVAAALIWPWPVAFALSLTGTMLASVVGFSFARFVARDWIATKVPAKFHRYDVALEKKGFATVFVLRLIFWMPPLLHAFFGVSKVRFWTHFWGSFLGYLLPLFLVSFFGQRLFDAMRRMPPSAWGIVFLGALAFGVSVWSVRRCRARA
ncbi:MAG: VTT domain-containing protein [Polyangiaceae bacterium]